MTTGPNDRYYRRLEVGPDASQAEIVQAYRRLAHGAHPDTHPEDPEAPRRFREITEAYEVLTDPAQRARRTSSRGDGRAIPITVVMRSTPNQSCPAWTDPMESPFVLGGARLAPGPLLRAGPVRVELDKTLPAPVRDTGAGDEESGLLRLFCDLFDSLWRF